MLEAKLYPILDNNKSPILDNKKRANDNVINIDTTGNVKDKKTSSRIDNLQQTSTEISMETQDNKANNDVTKQDEKFRGERKQGMYQYNPQEFWKWKPPNTWSDSE